jgi:hypothetical protein
MAASLRRDFSEGLAMVVSRGGSIVDDTMNCFYQKHKCRFFEKRHTPPGAPTPTRPDVASAGPAKRLSAAPLSSMPKRAQRLVSHCDGLAAAPLRRRRPPAIQP